jgi:hypothetical protein
MDEKKPIVSEHIMQFFAYDHLPAHLKAVSKPFADLAFAIVGDERGLPAGSPVQFPLQRNPERTVALRKLLEAKDAAVRAHVAAGVPVEWVGMAHTAPAHPKDG